MDLGTACMEKSIHFMSGSPRSGSSLICNILCQNPRFYASPTSGLVDVLYQTRNHWHTLISHKANPCQQKLNHVLAATMTAYYADIDRPVIIDRSRGWLPHVELAEFLLGRKAKVLVPVRPILDILASFELLYRETGKFRQPPGEAANYYQFQTVAGRCDYLLRNDQVVGSTLSRLQDVVVRGFKDRLLFIEFDRLTRDPRKVLQKSTRSWAKATTNTTSTTSNKSSTKTTTFTDIPACTRSEARSNPSKAGRSKSLDKNTWKLSRPEDCPWRNQPGNDRPCHGRWTRSVAIVPDLRQQSRVIPSDPIGRLSPIALLNKKRMQQS